MKKFSNMLFVLMISYFASYGQGIKFVKNLTWEQIMQKAKIENKYIFIDAYATWCAPCKKMDQEVFNKEDVGSFFNEHFISVKVQMDTTSSDDETIRRWYEDSNMLRNSFNISAFPSVVFLLSDGTPTHKIIGFRNEQSLLADAKLAMNPKGGYYSGLKRYNEGDRSNPAGIRQLANYSKFLGDNQMAQLIADEYISNLKEEEMFRPENLDFISDYTTSSKNLGFALFFKDLDTLKTLNNGRKYVNLLIRIISKEDAAPLLNNNLQFSNEGKIKSVLITKYGVLGEQVALMEISGYYYKKKEMNNFVRTKNLVFLNHPDILDNFTLANDAWFVFENTFDKKLLTTAALWAKKVIDEEPMNGATRDTYANLLYKLGRSEMAIEIQREAMLLDGDPAIKANYEKMVKKQKTWP